MRKNRDLFRKLRVTMSQTEQKLWITTSWDDGHPLDMRLAELLDKYGIAATFYIPRKSSHSGINAKQIRELSQKFEIGAHTLDHIYLDRVSDHQAKEQILGSRLWIEDVTGKECRIFCFPGGKFKNHQLSFVSDAGFRAARTAELLSIQPPRLEAGLFLLPTTVQAFPHRPYAYAKNALKRRHILPLFSSGALFRSTDWIALAKNLFFRALEERSVFHLWGHSWEIDDQNQWRKLRELLAIVAEHRKNLIFVPNTELCEYPGSAPETIPLASRFHGVPIGAKIGTSSPLVKPVHLPARLKIFADLSLSELPEGIRLSLAQWNPTNWFGSLAFASHYCYPPATRVSYLANEEGQILQACFYRQEKWGGVFHCLYLTSPTDPRSEIISRLACHHRPQVIRIPLLETVDMSRQWEDFTQVTTRYAANDCIIKLPNTPEECLRRLGNKFRRQLPYFTKQIDNAWNTGGRLEHAAQTGITRASFDELLALHRLRMGHRSLWTEALANHRWKLVQECGFLTCLRRDGLIAAGTLSFLHRDHAYLVIIAHDPAHDSLNLGSVILWRTMESFISSQLRSLHLLCADSSYEAQFGGLERPFYEAALISGVLAAKTWNVAEIFGLPRAWSLTRSLAGKVRSFLPPDRGKFAESGGS